MEYDNMANFIPPTSERPLAKIEIGQEIYDLLRDRSQERPVLTTLTEIEAWLQEQKIRNYTINKNLEISVEGDVELNQTGMEFIPIQFSKVSGYFYCAGLALATLKGCPREVGLTFDCSGNRLRNLEGCPTVVGGDFECARNYINTLKNVDIKVGGSFIATDNFIVDLKDLQIYVGLGGEEKKYFSVNDFERDQTAVKSSFGYQSFEDLVFPAVEWNAAVEKEQLEKQLKAKSVNTGPTFKI